MIKNKTIEQETMRRIYLAIMILLIVFTSTSCSGNHEIKKAAHNMADYILSNLSNDSIKCSDIRYSDDGILIEIYGSDSAGDVMEIADLSNNWMVNNIESIICTDSLCVSIELYLEKPEEVDREYLNYIAAFRNYDYDFDRTTSDNIDCLEIIQCHEFSTSLLDNGNDYRVIVLPGDVIVDNSEVFVHMDSLKYVLIKDYDFDNIMYSPEEINARIEEITGNHDVDFYVGNI